LFVVVDAVFGVGVGDMQALGLGGLAVDGVAMTKGTEGAFVAAADGDVVAWHGVVFLNRHLVALQGATW
jgi:hypothetical protein